MREEEDSWEHLICQDCNTEFWARYTYGNPWGKNVQYHLCPACYERAKREGTLPVDAVPRREPRPGTQTAGRMRRLSEVLDLDKYIRK